MALVADSSIGSQGGAEGERGSESSPVLSLADVEAVIAYVDLDWFGEINLKVRSDTLRIFLNPLGTRSVLLY